LFNSISRPTGEPNLQKALEASKRAFDQASPRPNAKKILVVIMDKKSIDKHEAVQEALQPLKEDVKVVPVAVGPDADKDQLKNLTSVERYLVEAEKTTTPEKIAKDIMDKVTSGMNSLIELCYCKCMLN